MSRYFCRHSGDFRDHQREDDRGGAGAAGERGDDAERRQDQGPAGGSAGVRGNASHGDADPTDRQASASVRL